MQHRGELHVEVRRAECLRSAELLDVFGSTLLRDVEHVVHGDDAQHVAAIVGHGQHPSVVFLERLQDSVTVVRGPHRDQLGIVDRHDVQLGRREHQIRETDIFHQLATGIDDVDPIEGFLPFAGLPDLVERRRGGHVRIDPGVLGSHVPAGGVLRVAEQLARGLKLLGIELQEQLPRDLGGHFLEQMGAVVRAHLVEQVAYLLVRQRVEQVALLRRGEIRKHPRRLLSRKQAEDYPLRCGRLRDDDVRDVRRVHRPQRVRQLVPLSPCYQFPDRIACLDHATHGRVPSVLWSVGMTG